ncbi:MAG: zinc-ribbon domain-containing protein [Sandaracinaceae bacterium]|nr:zinc-ribbon domain-containing protein [Sandaracinaceae bacterium]
MDVTCERCGTEYEFDETLVSGRGTTVKCTNCGHLFKVFRPDAEGAPKSWNVRGADGIVRKLSSLKELQRLITAGTLTEHDEIARGSEPYKRLGDIAELSTFFAAAAPLEPEDDAPVRQRKGTSPGMTPAPSLPERASASARAARPPEPPPRSPEPARAPPPTRPKDTPSASAAPPPSQRSLAARPAPPRPAPSTPFRRLPRRSPSPQARGAAPPSRAAPSQPPPSQPPAPARPSERPLYLDDGEPVVPPRGRSRSGLWVALVVLVAGAVGVALAWPSLAPVLGLGPEPSEERPALAHLEPGDAALAEDTISGYERALHHYTQALAFDDRDVETLTRISRAHALWAQALAFDASDLEADADQDPARRGEANALRREARRHADTALARAEDAVRYGSTSADAEVALADALRLTGDLTRARSRLDRALTFRSEPDAEALRVQALLAAADAGGDLTRARDPAEQAVAEAPTSIRARLLYARALAAAGDATAARGQIDAVLRREERHPRAVALRDRVAGAGAPAPTPPTPAEVEPAAPPTPAPAPIEPPPTTDTPPRDPGASTRGGRRGGEEPAPADGRAPPGRDYSFYVRRGDELYERGSHASAREHYEAALALRPGGSEALTGLGNVLLAQGDANGASNRFRAAAQQGYGEAYIGLGRAYRRLGRNDDAIAAFERYLQRMPTGSQASLARRQIEEMRGGSGGGGSSPPSGEGLPAPRETTAPPPTDTPAIDSEP